MLITKINTNGAGPNTNTNKFKPYATVSVSFTPKAPTKCISDIFFNLYLAVESKGKKLYLRL